MDELAPQKRGVAYGVGTLAGMFLGGVLLIAAWAKMIDPAAFEELIELEGLDAFLPTWIVAPIALAIEAGLGMALLLNVRRLGILIPSAALCAGFLFLTGRAYLAYVQGDRDPASACGCFGNLVERTPTEAFWGDTLLLLPTLCLAFLGRPRGQVFPRGRLEITVAVVLVALGFTWKSPDLPLDNLATRLAPGARLDALCVGQDEHRTCIDHMTPEFETGRHLLLIADLEQREFRYAVARLNALAAADANVRLVVLTAADADVISRFRWELAPAFEIRNAPARLLRPLYRRTPRSALIENGRVVRTYDGLPPAEDFTPHAPAPNPKDK